jgi:hypothetical protein
MSYYGGNCPEDAPRSERDDYDENDHDELSADLEREDNGRWFPGRGWYRG